MTALTPGTRVQITGGPWPERIGALGTIVGPPPGYSRYPWDKRVPAEVIVLLDDDPLVPVERRTRAEDNGGQAWTCAIGRGDVTPVGGAR